MNLTPTQKADELIEKYSNTIINFPYIDLDDDQAIGTGFMTHHSAVRCAIIAVDEILFSNPHSIIRKNYIDHKFEETGESYLETTSTRAFWQEVKQILTDRL